MTTKKMLVTGGMAGAMALSGMATVAALATEAPQAQNSQQALATEPAVSTMVEAPAVGGTHSPVVRADASAGTFAWDQATATPNPVIAAQFRGIAATLCSATDDFAQVNPLEWKLSVSGEVSEAFTATIDDMAADGTVSQFMTCTCGGNPADGRATFSADVKGIPVTYLLDRAQARAGVNTVVFVSSDGTEVAMPLAYVVARHGVISYEINGEDLSASVGGNNQLWLMGTSANYFVRDVVEVRVEARDAADVPANPGEGMDYPNSPNVGITAAQAEKAEALAE